jgi:hypothetical protein
MYKKLHISEKESLVESYCPKGSFACLIPERVIMLTNVVYDIQLKKTEKNYWPCSPVVFSVT